MCLPSLGGFFVWMFGARVQCASIAKLIWTNWCECALPYRNGQAGRLGFLWHLENAIHSRSLHGSDLRDPVVATAEYLAWTLNGI